MFNQVKLLTVALLYPIHQEKGNATEQILLEWWSIRITAVTLDSDRGRVACGADSSVKY